MASSHDYKSPYFSPRENCNCEAIIKVEDVRLFVSVDHLSKFSEFFRLMFSSDFREKNQNKYEITDEKADDVACFFEAIDPNPDINKIYGRFRFFIF